MSAVTADNANTNSSTNSKTETAPTKAPPNSRLVTINDNEQVYISKSSVEAWWLDDPTSVNDSVFKCSGCQLLTIHQGYQFEAISDEVYGENAGRVTKRVYLCTNCAKFCSK